MPMPPAGGVVRQNPKFLDMDLGPTIANGWHAFKEFKIPEKNLPQVMNTGIGWVSDIGNDFFKQVGFTGYLGGKGERLIDFTFEIRDKGGNGVYACLTLTNEGKLYEIGIFDRMGKAQAKLNVEKLQEEMGRLLKDAGVIARVEEGWKTLEGHQKQLPKHFK